LKSQHSKQDFHIYISAHFSECQDGMPTSLGDGDVDGIGIGICVVPRVQTRA